MLTAESAPASAVVEPMENTLVEEGRRRTERKTDKTRTGNKNVDINASIEINKGGSGLHTDDGGHNTPILPSPGVPIKGPGSTPGGNIFVVDNSNNNGWGWGWIKDWMDRPVWGWGPSAGGASGGSKPGIGGGSSGIGGIGNIFGGNKGSGYGVGSDEVGIGLGNLFGFGGNKGSGNGVDGDDGGIGLGSGNLFNQLFGYGGNKGGIGGGGGPGTGGGGFPGGSGIGGPGGSGIGGPGGPGGSGGPGGDNGIISVTYGKPPTSYYETHGGNIFNPLGNWLYPGGGSHGGGDGPGGYGPGGHGVGGPGYGDGPHDHPTMSEVLVIRYPEFVKTLGQGISRMTNAMRDWGKGMSDSFTKGVTGATSPITAGLGSGVASIIPLEDVGNINHNKGIGNSIGGPGGVGIGPGIYGNKGQGSGGQAGSVVYVDKYPSAQGGGGWGNWFGSPGSWFGNNKGQYGGGGDSLHGPTSTVYVEGNKGQGLLSLAGLGGLSGQGYRPYGSQGSKGGSYRPSHG